MGASPVPPDPAALNPGVVIGIVGAGAMGAGIAQVAATAGHPVRLFDTRDGAAKSAIENIGGILQKLVAKGKLTHQAIEQTRTLLQPVTTLQPLAGCGLIIEAIVEDLDAKRNLFAQLESIVDEAAILATNTSSLSVTAIAPHLRNPGRFAGMHFFNPAPVMPLIEIIRGLATADATARTLHATAQRWGKTPVRARSTPGFIVNRVARPFYAESLRLLNEGAVDCVTIDAVMRESGGFRMGPFELMDLIGNDVNFAVTRSVFEQHFGDPRFTPSLRQKELVDAGFLGRKSGRGFYTYADGVPRARPQTSPPAPSPTNIALYGDHVFSLAFGTRLAASNIALHRRPAHPDARIADGNSFVLYRSDGRTATARAFATGEPNTVLLDLVLDPANATRIALAVADQAHPQARRDALGLLQTAGYAVSEIDDAPAMIVFRTVAMLANEAADAVHQGVCSAPDCDLAMRLGVNYPRGPLQWAQDIGLAEILRVIDHLGQAYGEDRYRASPLLRRKVFAGASFHD